MLLSLSVRGFTPGFRTPFKRRVVTNLYSSSADSAVEEVPNLIESSILRAPIKYTGPYPCLALRFPELATPSQQKRNVSGISLDFVLDTAANTNTINRQVAKELGLEVVGSALPGLGSQGVISGGDTYLLGNSQLEGLSMGKDEFFMTNLTAAALPVANPATAGLLSLAFFYTFPGGVEFTWGAASPNGTIITPPSIAFHGDEDVFDVTENMVRVPIKPIPVTNLPSVTIQINGVSMPALLDTGSPVTVMNTQAAKVAGVNTVETETEAKKSNNPVGAAINAFKAAQAAAQASASGEVLAIMDSNGKRVELRKSLDKVHVLLEGDGDGVDFGSGKIYVGDIPGLAAMDAIGVKAPPAVVLGMDVLRTKPKMFLRARQNEVYF
jgi:Aspartyl protease